MYRKRVKQFYRRRKFKVGKRVNRIPKVVPLMKPLMGVGVWSGSIKGHLIESNQSPLYKEL